MSAAPMPAGSGNFECTFYVFLPSYVAEIKVKPCLLLVKLLSCVDNYRLEAFLSRKKLNDIKHIFHAIDFEIVDHGSLSDIALRHYQPLEML